MSKLKLDAAGNLLILSAADVKEVIIFDGETAGLKRFDAYVELLVKGNDHYQLRPSGISHTVDSADVATVFSGDVDDLFDYLVTSLGP